jgi:hypothetical protein
MKRIYLQPLKSDEDSTPESILYTKYCLNWNGNLNNPTDSKDNCETDGKFDIELANVNKDAESPERGDKSTMPNVAGLIQPLRMSNRIAEKWLVAANAIQIMSNMGIKNKYERKNSEIVLGLFCYLTENIIPR